MLCERCERVCFASSSIQTESPLDFYSPALFPSGLELPSDATGLFFAHNHHPDIRSLLHSAGQRGCHLCTQILRSLEQVGLVLDSPHEYHDGPIELRWYPHPEKLRAGLSIRELFAVARTGLRDIKTSLAFMRFLSYEEQTELALLSLPSLLDSRASGAERHLWSTGCDSNLLLAGLWLKRCLTEHPLCALSTDASPTLPTRVLDVGALCDAGGGIYLVDGRPRHGPYVALSHVWGATRVITTVRSNIEQRGRGIPLESLSQTFRDAVLITRKLSIQYLWIDSLCALTPKPSIPLELFSRSFTDCMDRHRPRLRRRLVYRGCNDGRVLRKRASHHLSCFRRGRTGWNFCLAQPTSAVSVSHFHLFPCPGRRR